jgi:hypothetical protein
MADPNYACRCCHFPPGVQMEIQSRWVECCFSPCGSQKIDSTEDKAFYSVVTFTGRGYTSVTTYSRDENGNCKSELTSCSGTTTSTDKIVLTYDPYWSPRFTGGSGSEEIIRTQKYIYNAETKTCDWEATATGTSKLNVTWTGGVTDIEGSVDSGTYDCSRTYDGVKWSGHTGNSCLADWVYRDLIVSYYPGFLAEASIISEYDPDPGETPTTEFSGALTPTCDYPDFAPWPDDEDVDSELPPLGLCQSRGSGSALASQQLDPADNPIKRKLEFRIRHNPSGSCYLKVWFRKTTIEVAPYADPPVDNTVKHDDSTFYEWEGSGNPCIPDKNKSVEDPANLITGDPIEIPPPEIGEKVRLATVSVRILKFSYLRDYEPDISDPENPQPNGSPDPLWEAAAP